MSWLKCISDFSTVWNRLDVFGCTLCIWLKIAREGKSNKHKTPEHFSDTPLKTIVQGHRSQAQTDKMAIFFWCRERSQFVPGRGPACPRDGSGLPRSPSCWTCACLLFCFLLIMRWHKLWGRFSGSASIGPRFSCVLGFGADVEAAPRGPGEASKCREARNCFETVFAAQLPRNYVTAGAMLKQVKKVLSCGGEAIWEAF